MNTKIKSYQDAKEFLGNKLERPYANNTRIKWDNQGHDLIIVTYHDNPIVHFYPDRVSLWTCNWYTLTTKERLNWFLPDGFYVYQERGTWFLSDRINYKHYVFAEGITVCNGEVYNFAPESREDEIKALTKQINKYAKEYAHALVNSEIESPNSGDCWFCYFQSNGQSLGDETKNIDHLQSHFDESYFVPSLLINAVKQYPMCLLSNSTMYQLWESGEAISNWQKDILERDVKSSITKYLKKQFSIAR